jgi:hypothetical protein
MITSLPTESPDLTIEHALAKTAYVWGDEYLLASPVTDFRPVTPVEVLCTQTVSTQDTPARQAKTEHVIPECPPGTRRGSFQRK